MITATLINEVFRGSAYGRYDIFTPASFRTFVKRNDVDLSRAITVSENGAVAGAVAYGLRGERAWFALIGVKPQFRRRGYGWQLFCAVVDAARTAGARTMEFEVMQHNRVAVAMYRKLGFEIVDELSIWARPRRARAHGGLQVRKQSETSICAVARSPAACWQREPRSIALAPPSALVTCEGAYAFVRPGCEHASLLDAGARDEACARDLLCVLDRRVREDLTLVNEPTGSPLSRALRKAGWRVVNRQHRMMRAA